MDTSVVTDQARIQTHILYNTESSPTALDCAATKPQSHNEAYIILWGMS